MQVLDKCDVAPVDLPVNETVGATIRRRRKAIGVTQEDLASATNISPRQLSRIENDVYDDSNSVRDVLAVLSKLEFRAAMIRKREVEERGRAAHHEPLRRTSLNELGNETNGAIGEAPPPGELPDEIPLLADVRGGLPDGGVYDGTIEAHLPVRRLYGIRDPQAFALRVVGDSMAPRMPEETVVYVSPNEARLDGEPCFVQFGGERDYMATIKNVYDAGSHWLLIANNQNFTPQTERVLKSHVVRVLPVVRYSVPTR